MLVDLKKFNLNTSSDIFEACLVKFVVKFNPRKV